MGAYVDTCHICAKKSVTAKKQEGANRFIASESYRDCQQVDLINTQSYPCRNWNGVLMTGILHLKDHFTMLSYFRAIPKYTAGYEINLANGLLGCPLVSQSDNGSKFKQNNVLESVKVQSEQCFTVYGAPREPWQQGSPEHGNGGLPLP